MNYPDSVNPADPQAPWNQVPIEPTEYVVTVDFYITDLSPEEASEEVLRQLQNIKIFHETNGVIEA